MSLESTSVLRPFILSWNLKNIVDELSMFVHDEFCINGICLGEYPIDAWKHYYLEIPKNGHKKDISGRGNNVFGIGMKNTKWDYKRVLPLPKYSNCQQCDDTILEKLKLVIRDWDQIYIPDDIPCIAIAVKCEGFYSDCREAQSVTVLLIWNDGVARIMSLDWFEGPLEDCITPEWYVETTSLLRLEEAFKKIQNCYSKITWDNTNFSILTIPLCLGRELRGKKVNTSYTPWSSEWKYKDHGVLKNDLNQVLSRIREIFLIETLECDAYE